MCLIIASPNGTLPEHELLVQGFSDNNDAWGIAWVTDGKIMAVKGYKLESMLKAANRVKGKPYMLHFRFSTHGDNSLENGHPFQVAENIWMMHNGIIQISRKRADRSDTFEFADQVRELMIEEPEWYGSKDFAEDVGDFVGSYNKIVFLDNTGKLTFCNERSGSWYTKDIWLSNENAVRALRAPKVIHSYTPKTPSKGYQKKLIDEGTVTHEYGIKHYNGYPVHSWDSISDKVNTITGDGYRRYTKSDIIDSSVGKAVDVIMDNLDDDELEELTSREDRILSSLVKVDAGDTPTACDFCTSFDDEIYLYQDNLFLCRFCAVETVEEDKVAEQIEDAPWDAEIDSMYSPNQRHLLV